VVLVSLGVELMVWLVVLDRVLVVKWLVLMILHRISWIRVDLVYLAVILMHLIIMNLVLMIMRILKFSRQR